MNSRLALSLLLCSLALTACGPQANLSALPTGSQSQTQVTPSQNQAVLGSALYKRTLQLARIDGKVVPIAAIAPLSPAAFNIQQIAVAEPAIARPAIEPYFYYGGNDFNQYVIQYAEENFYPGSDGKSLLEVYQNTVKPILAEWDSSARLIESRAQVNAQDYEYVYLPDQQGEPLKIKPDYIFRFASTPRKETMNIYVMAKETRVHRMVWGEPEIQIDRVKVDSDEALLIAKKAFANQEKDPGYPVYPDMVKDPNMEVIYDLPSDLHWQIQLNQQSKDQLHYFLNFNFVRQVKQVDGGPTPPPKPMPDPMPLIAESGQTDSATNSTTTNAGSPDSPDSKPGYYDQYLNGSIEIDAISGKIYHLNRPVLYTPRYASGGSADGNSGEVSMGYAVAPPVPVAETATAQAE